jgi:hypothetical protein
VRAADIGNARLPGKPFLDTVPWRGARGVKSCSMLRLTAFLFVAAGVGALFGPRRLRVVFWLVGAAALAYTALRLLGVVEGPHPAGSGVP